MSIAIWIVTGLLAGWLATVIIGRSAYGLLGDAVVGTLGAFAGGGLTSSFLGIDVTTPYFPSIVVGLGGAIILIAFYRAVVPAEGPQF